jgi:prepilin-type N-terminal cleavage/methylation domain-containing protein
MQNRHLKRVVRSYGRGRQKGFTLIELLVVISILGILAAIVTLSLVGITGVATQHASKTELQEVQTAYDTMLADQIVSSGLECGGTSDADATLSATVMTDPKGTSNMTSADIKVNGVTTKAWITSNDSAAVTAGGDGSHLPVALYPNYLRQQSTHGSYYCTPHGIIVQASYTP